jgi:hypothetical protein
MWRLCFVSASAILPVISFTAPLFIRFQLMASAVPLRVKCLFYLMPAAWHVAEIRLRGRVTFCIDKSDAKNDPDNPSKAR